MWFTEIQENVESIFKKHKDELEKCVNEAPIGLAKAEYEDRLKLVEQIEKEINEALC